MHITGTVINYEGIAKNDTQGLKNKNILNL